MKTPKVTKPTSAKKYNGPKSGKIQKSTEIVSGKKLNALSKIKTADQALSLLNADSANINIKVNKKKGKFSGKDTKFSPNKENSPSKNKALIKKGIDKNTEESVLKKKSPLGSKKAKQSAIQNGIGKAPQKEKDGCSVAGKNDLENNTSPIKVTKDKKKVKIPFELDDSLLTPAKSKKTDNAQSPEVLLGLELEKALSPKSKKGKKKQLMQKKLQEKGKVEVLKDVSNATQSESGESRKKKRKRRGKKTKKPLENLENLTAESLFGEINAKNALKALLKTTKATQSEQKDLFGEDRFIYLQCNLFKGHNRGVFHITLPHLILPDTPDICLITADLKGKRNDPDEAIDFYNDLLKNNGIDFITEIIPIRKMKKEYSTFEHRRNLCNRFDAFLVEGKVSRFARTGRKFSRFKKCVSAVQLDAKDLKTELDKGLRKVALFSGGNGLSLSLKCGREGMSLDKIVDNIMAIGKFLVHDKFAIGNHKNISSVYVKTALSPSFPIYVSISTPNDAPFPEGRPQKLEEPVEGEVSTVLGATVVVHPSGNVKVKKNKKEDLESDEIIPQKKSKVDNKNKQNPKAIKKQLQIEEQNEDSEDDSDSLEGMEGNKNSDEEDESELDEEASEIEDDGSLDEESGDEDEGTNNSLAGDSDSDMDEAKIAAAEMEFLKEVRILQDGFAKNKKKAGSSPKKPLKMLQEKAEPQVQTGIKGKGNKKHKQANKNNMGSEQVTNNSPKGKQTNQKQQAMKENNQKVKQGKQLKPDSKPEVRWQKKSGNKNENKLGNKPAVNQVKKPGNKNFQQNKLGKPTSPKASENNQKLGKKLPQKPGEQITQSLSPKQLNKDKSPGNKKRKFEKSVEDNKSSKLGKKVFQGGKKLKSK